MIMPRMNGTELIARIKESHKDAKTMIMTAYGITQDSVDENIKVIPKPFDMDTLALAIKESLNEKKGDSAAAAD